MRRGEVFGMHDRSAPAYPPVAHDRPPFDGPVDAPGPLAWADLRLPPPAAVESSADAPDTPLTVAGLLALSDCPELMLVSAADSVAAAVSAATRALAAGRRVVVLAADPCDADKLVARLRSHAPVRALGAGEMANQLPAASGERTARALGEAAAAAARAQIHDRLRLLDARREALRAVLDAGDAPPAADWSDDHARLSTEIDRLPDTLAAETDTPFAHARRGLADRHAAALAAADQEVAAAQNALAAGRIELDQVRAEAAGLAAEAAKPAGLFAAVKHLFHRDDAPARAAHLDARLVELTAVEAALVRDAQAADEARGRLHAGSAAEAEALIAAERDRRAAALADRLAEVTARRTAALAAEAARRSAWAAAGFSSPPDPDVAAARLAQADADHADTHALLSHLDAPTLGRRLAATHRLVVGPASGVGRDPALAGPHPAFDRLILADADAVPDRTIDAALAVAGGWTLVGACDPKTAFGRLWTAFHRPAWGIERGGWVARLAPVPAHQRSRLRCEPVFDRPDVELRFALGGQTLVEVAFPRGRTAATAKEFLAQELGETRPAPIGEARWDESADAHLVVWPDCDSPEAEWADLGDGVRERTWGDLTADPPAVRTAALAFDKAAGWTADTAADWLAHHALPPPRTATAPRPDAAPVPARRPASAGVRQ